MTPLTVCVLCGNHAYFKSHWKWLHRNEQQEKSLFSLLISITPFYVMKNFSNDSQEIKTFPCNCFYFQDELVRNWVLHDAKRARIFGDLEKINHTKWDRYLFFFFLNETTEVSEMFHKCAKQSQFRKISHSSGVQYHWAAIT